MSAKYFEIPINITKEDMEKAISELIYINSDNFSIYDEHRIMINVSRGLLSIYKNISNIKHGTNIIISDFPLRWTVSGMGDLFDVGVNAVIPSQRSIPSHLLDAKVKCRSRAHYLKANIEVSKYKGNNNWALLLDTDGFITEGTGCNFFMVSNNKLYTPEPRNILRGISRDYVIEIAKKLNLECKEENIDQYDLYHADEAFFTATPFCILPITSINGNNISSGIGTITKLLLKEWSKNVDVDIVNQIKIWDKKNEKNDGTSPYKFS
jgi:branched-chain amino acid aminotransferase